MKNRCFLKYTVIKNYEDGSLECLPIRKRECFNDWKEAKKREKQLNRINQKNLVLNIVTDLYSNIEITYNQ